ncbi:MAG: bifunctional diguanylate cyclase/phosphohydrolase [Candidatus Limnocylindrales bacterium]
MRLLGFLALAAPVVLGILLLGQPATLSWLGDSGRSVVAALAVATIGVYLTIGVFQLRSNLRLRRLINAAEKIADGDYTIGVSTRGSGLERRLASAINRISVSLADTHDRATIDRLTGVFNRQALLAELFAEVERASRYDRPLSVAFVDIDHFKMVNDTYGHGAGDIVLRGVAQTLVANLRASDLLGRYGGEEFMLILTETAVEEGAVLAEKLRSLVERERFAIAGEQSLSVTISIGIVGGFGEQLRMEALVRDADAAMYSAKSLGRNQTYVFAEPSDDARVPRAPISAVGRARAVDIGRQAREAATAALLDVLGSLPEDRGRPSAMITTIVESMARTLQLPDAEVERIRVAALLHDIGKLALPNEILDKRSPLTSAEWRSVVQHPRIGQVILEQAAALKDAIPIILHHHERFAGHGYPYGLRSTEIPLGARIVAIADAYDAMVHERPYKPALGHEAALEELRRHAGTQFDPELVTLFCDLFAVAAPTPDPAMRALGRPATRVTDRRITEQAASTDDHRRRASRAAPPSTKTMASDVEMTVGFEARPAAAEGAGLKQPANPEGRGRATG